MAIVMCAVCVTAYNYKEKNIQPYVDSFSMEEVVFEEEMVALSAVPDTSGKSVPAVTTAVPSIIVAEASGKSVAKNGNIVIDYSNVKDGYVMVNYGDAAANRIKAQLKGPETTYTYNLNPNEWTTLPLSDGNGNYQVAIYKNVGGNKYSQSVSASFSAVLKDEFAPFLIPNPFVDYKADSKTVEKAAELTNGITDTLKKVEAVYDFVVGNLTYDKEKAMNVKSGYLPVLDDVLAAKKGICFDYASLMTGMLRSQGVPCKLVVGYAGTTYHAWISVWTEETGWIDGVIFFDSQAWHRMDPTFASTGNKSEDVIKYIGDGTNYTAKYLY